MVVNITLIAGSSGSWQIANWWQDATRRAFIFSRFWSLVKRGTAEECWLWRGYVASHGYGQFSINGVRHRAHRFAWIYSRGDVPDGLQVCHACDNTACVNPSHLFLGSARENHLDSVCKGRKRVFGIQRLNAVQVQEIRALIAAGWTQKAVGQKFGVARSTISGIVRGVMGASGACLVTDLALGFFLALGLVVLSDDQRRTAAQRIREALRLANLALSEAASMMAMAHSDLTRGLSGERRLDYWRLEMLPEDFHRHLALLELRDRGLPEYAKTALKVFPAIDLKKEA